MPWKYREISGYGEKPRIVGAYEEVYPGGLLILGGGRTVWEDYRKAKSLFNTEREYEIMCINDIAGQFKAETIQHIVSCHQRLPKALSIMRKEKSMLEACLLHSSKPSPGLDFVWEKVSTNGGSSAMLAVKIAIAIGYNKIILCGVPLDTSGHYFDPPVHKDNSSSWFDGATRNVWKEFYRDNAFARDNVMFMSGTMQEIYHGEPTREWVYAKHSCCVSS